MKQITTEFLVELYKEILDCGGYCILLTNMVDGSQYFKSYFLEKLGEEEFEEELDNLFEKKIKLEAEPEYQIINIPDNSMVCDHLNPKTLVKNPILTGYRFFHKSGRKYCDLFPITPEYIYDEKICKA